MAELKHFLDYEGLKLYDEKIKALIAKTSAEDLEAYIGQLPESASNETVISYLEKKISNVDDKIGDISELTSETVTNLAQALNTELVRASAEEAKLEEAINILNGDGEGSVSKQVADAVDSIVDGAPEALDTLKEIASWIEGDETGSAELINRVANLENADEEMKDYIDARDEELEKSFKAIDELKIMSLFPSIQKDDESAADFIASVEEGSALKLKENQVITEDVSIEKSCYIDANGSTFEGTVSVPADIDVIIENAVFAKPVVIA